MVTIQAGLNLDHSAEWKDLVTNYVELDHALDPRTIIFNGTGLGQSSNKNFNSG